MLGCVLGSIVAQVGMALEGVRTALVAVAAVLAGIVVWLARRLIEVDEVADAPVVEIRLLRRIPLFAPLPGPALEGVARATRPHFFVAGETVVREGDVGDEYYAIVDGDVDVTMGGRHVRTMGRGEGFGEHPAPFSPTCLVPPPWSPGMTARSSSSTEAPSSRAVTGHDASRQAAVERGACPALRTRQRRASKAARTTPRRPRHRCGHLTESGPHDIAAGVLHELINSR